MNISPFRVTDEDLAGLDAKTREGLQPLLDSLNVTLRQLVEYASNATPLSRSYSTQFNSSAGGSAYVDFQPPPNTPSSLAIDQIRRIDGAPMTTVYSWSWTRLDSGVVRVLFVGLDTEVTYFLAATIK